MKEGARGFDASCSSIMVMNAKVGESPREHYQPGGGYQWYTTTTPAAPNVTETYAAVPTGASSSSGGHHPHQDKGAPQAGCCSWCCEGLFAPSGSSYAASTRNGHRPANSESDEDGFGGVVLSVTGGAVLNHYTNNSSNLPSSNQIIRHERNSIADDSETVCCLDCVCCTKGNAGVRRGTAGGGASTGGGTSSSAHHDTGWCRPTILLLLLVLLIVVFVLVSGILLYLNCTCGVHVRHLECMPSQHATFTLSYMCFFFIFISLVFARVCHKSIFYLHTHLKNVI